MVRMVKAGPARRNPRSRGAMPKTWPAMPSRSMASLSVLVEWCLNSSINSSKFDCLLLLGRRSGPPPPDPGRRPGGAGLGPAPASGPGSGLLAGEVGLEHGLLERRHGGVGLVAEVPRHRLVEAAQGADDVGILLGQLLAE